jgi:hypothetical protein
MEWETPEHIKSQVLKLDNMLLTSEGRIEMIKEMTKLIKEATFDTICQYKARSTGTDWRQQLYICAFRNSQHDCRSFSTFEISDHQLKFKDANWTHSHPFDPVQLQLRNSITDGFRNRIQELSRMRCSAVQIRTILETSISKYTLYEARRDIIEEMRKDEVAQLFDTIKVWKNWSSSIGHSQNEFHYAWFVHSRVASNQIVLKYLIMDETSCTNTLHLPLFIIVGVDENDFTQIVSFGILENCKISSITQYCQYFKSKISYPPQSFIVDREQGQFASITQIFPDSKIIFCKKHIAANITIVMKDPYLVDLF